MVAALLIFSLFAGGLQFSLPRNLTGEFVDEPPGYETRGTAHIQRDEPHPPYSSVPATSGWHYFDAGAPAGWGVHQEALPDEVLVHNLEHAGVGVHYDCPDGCDELIAQLADIAGRYRKVIMSPYPGMDTRIALTAWTYQDKFDEFDEDRVVAFIVGHMGSNNAPEPFGR